MKTEDKIKRILNSEKQFVDEMPIGDVQQIKLEFENDKYSHAKMSHNGIAYPITTRVDNCNYYLISKENEMDKEQYRGTYDYAQSDTLRPSEERRTHLDSDTSGSLLASGNQNGVMMENTTTGNLAIRRLTGKECLRLMGFSDLAYERAKEVIPESQIYRVAGDSIVVNVIEAMIEMML